MVGYLGGLLEKMGGAAFWYMHAGLCALGAVLLLVLKLLFGKLLAPSVDPELKAEMAAA